MFSTKNVTWTLGALRRDLRALGALGVLGALEGLGGLGTLGTVGQAPAPLGALVAFG